MDTKDDLGNLKERQLWRPQSKWKDIRMGLQSIKWDRVDWIQLESYCENGDEYLVCTKYRNFVIS
jgi:hypothetical protein